DRLHRRALAEWFRRRASSRLVRFLVSDARTFDVIIVFKGVEFPADALRAARDRSKAILVNINPDDPFQPSSARKRLVEAIPIFDLYCTWSRRVERQLTAAGAAATFYLPFAHDRESHVPAPVGNEDAIFTFCGSWDPEREAT